MAALFSMDVDGPSEENPGCQDAGKAQAPTGIEIKTHWGECWEVPEASKGIARGLMAAER
jgi:hypothetical protein